MRQYLLSVLWHPFYNLEDDGLVSIQHKGRVEKDNLWDDIREQVLDCIFNTKEIQDVCEKKRIYKDGILNCAGFQKNVGKNSTLVQIKDIFNIEKGSLASDKSEDGEFDFITGAEEWKTHIEYDHDKEAIIYVTKAGGSIGRSHYANGKFIASNLCIILTPINKKLYPINLQFYNAYLNNKRKKIVSDLADGTSKLTIKDTDFKKYYVDYISIDKQDVFVANNLIEYKEKVQKLKELVRNSEEKISSNFKELI